MFPEQLTEQSREHAAEAEADEGRETGEGAQGSWRDKLFSSESWERIARAFFGEWRMVWKELLFGFTVAGFISVFVPQSFWNALFLISGEGGPDPDPGFLVVLENALVAPVVAFFTFIGSMGNIPLAAMLWSRAIPLQSAYCAAKHAVKGFTQALRTELIHDRSRVRVTMVHLPAHNTPQFGWVKSRLPRKAQPVPPIFQPEVAAEAVLWASDHPTRERWVGWPTIKAILGERVIPGLIDRYLATHGYSGQQTDEPAVSDRPHNLWEPVPGDHGSHGAFDHRARERSWQLWASMHRAWLLVGVLAAVVLGLSVALAI